MASDTKKLTAENWLDPDPASLMSITLRFPGRDMPSPPWPKRLETILRPRLSESVPAEVAALFEAAQATMAYGYFFYPLHQVGAGHLYRALEAAATARARALGFKEQKPAGLRRKLEWLVSRGAVTKAEFDKLMPLVTLRNEASHPQSQSLIPPALAIALLDDVGDEINRLLGGRAAADGVVPPAR